MWIGGAQLRLPQLTQGIEAYERQRWPDGKIRGWQGLTT